jgi:4-hydroxy-tetrahydrodipicolinate synthase
MTTYSQTPTAPASVTAEGEVLRQIGGLLPALVTPFGAGGTIDETKLRTHIDRTIEAGADGLVVCGGTGEFFALASDERRRLIELACAQAADRVPVIAQTGAMSNQAAIERSQQAEAAGASCLMIALPYYEPVSAEQAFEYFATIAEAVELPIMLYNYPAGTGFRMSADFIVRMAGAHDSIQYVKDSSADPVLLGQLMAHNDTIGTLCGEDVLVAPALLLGAQGLITGSLNFMMPVHVAMKTAAAAGDDATVVRLWREILPLLTFLATHAYTDAVKRACGLLGHEMGGVRAPQPSLSVVDATQLEQLIKQLDPSYFS